MSRRQDNEKIERLVKPASEADIEAMGELLAAAIASGEALGFVSPCTPEDAAAWWQDALESAGPRSVCLVARNENNEVIGTVLLAPAWAPNQPHRAEVVKLLVRADVRGAGLGTRLMRAIEAEARDAGLTLLTLDAKRGEAAERLYRRLGWTEVGVIPRFAVDPDGVTPHDAVLFYKEL